MGKDDFLGFVSSLIPLLFFCFACSDLKVVASVVFPHSW
uniref:Uncharacterized protein n=1 Tax=Arundo donax TaxID=35708 RepID=A0A0A9FWN5_ARUDO